MDFNTIDWNAMWEDSLAHSHWNKKAQQDLWNQRAESLNEIIEHEKHTLSDFELVDLLKEQGFAVARRTVAKYRSMEGILPAHMRQVTP